jgi:hypothetical protein
VNQTLEVVFWAVPRQSLRDRSKWESAPGPSGAALAGATADAERCEAIENTVPNIRVRITRTMGNTTRQRKREEVGVDIQHFSFELIEFLKNPLLDKI